MPMQVANLVGFNVYASPFLDEVTPVQMPVDMSTLLIDGANGAQMDQYGFLKPGVPFKLVTGKLVPLDGTSGEVVYGVTIEATRLIPWFIGAPPVTNAALAAITNDPFIAVDTRNTLNRDIVESNLGRALSAAELAAFVSSHFVLTLP